jgi:hypothetical protein
VSEVCLERGIATIDGLVSLTEVAHDDRIASEKIHNFSRFQKQSNDVGELRNDCIDIPK